MKILHFETMHDFVEHALHAPRAEGWTDDSQRDSRSNHSSFSGSKDINEAGRLALEGWPEGLQRMTQKINLVLSKGKSKFRAHDVAGDLPDVGRFLAGVPVCMTRRVISDSMRKPIIELIVMASFSAYIDAETIMNYGAAITAAIDELEGAGFSVGLKIATGTDVERGGLHTVLNIKKPGEVMELDRLVFALAHPSFLRRLGFSIWETMTTAGRLGGSYGTPTDLSRELIPEGTVYFGRCISGERMASECRTINGAYGYVRSVIKQQRPDLFDELQAA